MTTTTRDTRPAQVRRLPAARDLLTVRTGITAVLVAIVVWAALTTEGFLTIANGRAILATMAFTGLVAIGMTLIMIGGNLFSLSLGSALAVSAIVYVAMLPFGLVAAIPVALAVGAVVSGIQGWLIAVVAANPIIVTLAGATVSAGVVGLLTEGRSLSPPGGVAGYSALSTPIAGLPVAVFAMVAVALVVQFWLSRSVSGRTTFLVGTSRPAAVAAGVSVVRVTTTVFAIAGLCAAIAGVLLASLNDNAGLSLAGTYNYDAIAAAVVGGAAISGGRGSVLMTLVGALFIATVGDLMLLRGFGTGMQIMVKGVIVLVFVLLAARVGRPKS